MGGWRFVSHGEESNIVKKRRWQSSDLYQKDEIQLYTDQNYERYHYYICLSRLCWSGEWLEICVLLMITDGNLKDDLLSTVSVLAIIGDDFVDDRFDTC